MSWRRLLRQGHPAWECSCTIGFETYDAMPAGEQAWYREIPEDEQPTPERAYRRLNPGYLVACPTCKVARP